MLLLLLLLPPRLLLLLPLLLYCGRCPTAAAQYSHYLSRLPLRLLLLLLVVVVTCHHGRQVYGYALRCEEKHKLTCDTMPFWLRDFMGSRNITPTVPPVDVTQMYFTNFFVTKVARNPTCGPHADALHHRSRSH